MPAPRTRNLGSFKVATPGEAPAAAGRQIVVVVGIDDYQHWPKLANAVTDARGVFALFTEKLGFEAPLPPLLDGQATLEALTQLVRDRLPALLKADDSLLLFYAGHGHTRVSQIGGKAVETGFLVPAPAKRDRFGDLLPIDTFLTDLAQLPARHVLVVLDACHSGFGLGEAMVRTRGVAEYAADVGGRVSRKIITSARREQLALDGGPVAGHSLFTGTLVEGFNWGRADLDGNGLVTASELGLYLQQQVGQSAQARQSKQTPDFGAFKLDDRGELVISLRDDRFAALKARTHSALLQGRLGEFGALLLQVLAQRPDSPEAQYLLYRARLLACDPKGAREAVDRLLTLQLPQGVVPLSENDLRQLHVQLEYWHDVLALPPAALPVSLGFETGPAVGRWQPAERQPFEGGEACLVRNGAVARFVAVNGSERRAHLYYLAITPHGRLLVGPLLEDYNLRTDGLLPGATGVGSPFKVVGVPSVAETRVLHSPERVPELLFGVTIATRSIGPFHNPAVERMTMQRVWHRIVEAHPGRG
jgi:hypothetical protein